VKSKVTIRIALLKTVAVFPTTSIFPHFSVSVYRKTGGVIVVSPLSLASANYFMEDFEELALRRAAYRPMC
jgi:hypothetical protein